MTAHILDDSAKNGQRRRQRRREKILSIGRKCQVFGKVGSDVEMSLVAEKYMEIVGMWHNRRDKGCEEDVFCS